MNNAINNLKFNLKLLRNYLNLSQEEMAEYFNVSRSCYSLYELGKRMPDLETIYIVSLKFNLTIDSFFLDKKEFTRLLLKNNSP